MKSSSTKITPTRYPMNAKQIVFSCSLHFLAGFFLAKQSDKLGPIAQAIASPWCSEASGSIDGNVVAISPHHHLRQVDIQAIADEIIAKELQGKITMTVPAVVAPTPTPTRAPADVTPPPPRPPTVPSASLPTDQLKMIANTIEVIGNEKATTTSTVVSTEFHRIVQTAYQFANGGGDDAAKQQRRRRDRERNQFDLNTWLNSGLTTKGGLDDDDRMLLGQIYGQANSVFEYGLGESTYLANYLDVPRYAGIDSDPVWVHMARNAVLSSQSQSSSHSNSYRFYLGDIGPTAAWGFPHDPTLHKNLLTYQLGPLLVEQEPFDVYMVDGRYRLPCLLASFLHASAATSRGATKPTQPTIVLVHDCASSSDRSTATTTSTKVDRDVYHQADHLLELDDASTPRLCVYKRKPETTDSQLSDLWLRYARHDA